MSVLRLILGDQLSNKISSLQDADKQNDIVLLCEVWQEATYVKHHKKKIAFLFSAMRHFSHDLRTSGFNVHYIDLENKDNSGSLLGEVQRTISTHKINRVIVTHPGEYRLLADMLTWEKQINVPIEIRPDKRFLCSITKFTAWAEQKTHLRMEHFYRDMRRNYQILLDNGKPCGGKWNYDSANRKPPNTQLDIPQLPTFKIDAITAQVLKLVAKKFPHHFGDLLPFNFAVTRRQALYALRDFIAKRLPLFGNYQDAMITAEPYLYHSILSYYLNCGLLEPLECIQAAEIAYRHQQAPLNAVEAFIRQILGWREYIRGIYWYKMPDYKHQNFFAATKSLPDFFWTGNTQLNCMRQCIVQTKKYAYAHHIQRLMVLGNYALLTGIDPQAVNEWYLIVYADAYEWVELPNVSGMILFADGGYLASKPYAASGAYINKMSNYCQSCHYKVTLKSGDNACPFNYLYWNFLLRHRNKLRTNHRLAMIYKVLDRMSKERLQAIKKDSRDFLTALTDS